MLCPMGKLFSIRNRAHYNGHSVQIADPDISVELGVEKVRSESGVSRGLVVTRISSGPLPDTLELRLRFVPNFEALIFLHKEHYC